MAIEIPLGKRVRITKGGVVEVREPAPTAPTPTPTRAPSRPSGVSITELMRQAAVRAGTISPEWAQIERTHEAIQAGEVTAEEIRSGEVVVTPSGPVSVAPLRREGREVRLAPPVDTTPTVREIEPRSEVVAPPKEMGDPTAKTFAEPRTIEEIERFREEGVPFRRPPPPPEFAPRDILREESELSEMARGAAEAKRQALWEKNFNEARALEREKGRIETETNKLYAEKDRIERDINELETWQPTTQSEASKYNRKVKAVNARISNYNKKAFGLGEKLSTYNKRATVLGKSIEVQQAVSGFLAVAPPYISFPSATEPEKISKVETKQPAPTMAPDILKEKRPVGLGFERKDLAKEIKPGPSLELFISPDIKPTEITVPKAKERFTMIGRTEYFPDMPQPTKFLTGETVRGFELLGEAGKFTAQKLARGATQIYVPKGAEYYIPFTGRKITTESIIGGAGFLGEVITFQAFLKTPKALEQTAIKAAPSLLATKYKLTTFGKKSLKSTTVPDLKKISLGERGELGIIKKKGAKIKLPKQKIPEPLKPIAPREYLGPELGKYLKVPGKKIPKPPTLKPVAPREYMGPELGKYIRPKGWKPPKPPTLKPTVPREYFGGELGKFLKPVPTKKIPKVTLKPTVPREYMGPELGKFLRVPGKKPPKPPTLKPVAPREYLGPELGKYLTVQKFKPIKITKQVIKPPKIIAPTSPTTAGLWRKPQKPTLEFVKEIEKIIKPPKPIPVKPPTRVSYFPPSVPTKAEAKAYKFLLTEIKAAQKAKLPSLKPAPVVKKASVEIPESYAKLAAGLARVPKTPTEKLFEKEITDLLEEKPKGPPPPVKTGIPEVDEMVGKYGIEALQKKPPIPEAAKYPKFDVSGRADFDKYIKELKEQETTGIFALKGKSPVEKEFAESITRGPKLGEYLGKGVAPAFKEFAKSREALSKREALSQREMQKQKEILSELTGISKKEAERQRRELRSQAGLLSGLLSADVQRKAYREREATREALREATRQKTIEKTAVKTFDQMLTRRVPKFRPPYEPPPKIPKEPKKPRIPKIPTISFKEFIKKPTREFGFRVLVRGPGKRVKGRWVPGEFKLATPFVMPRPIALAYGQKEVIAAAKRTFKIEPAIGKLIEPKLPRFKPEMFRRKGRTYIERTKYAIDTFGEEQEITRKGLKALQTRAWNLFAPKTKAIKKKKKTKRSRR